jgi:hypothetical protein
LSILAPLSSLLMAVINCQYMMHTLLKADDCNLTFLAIY